MRSVNVGSVSVGSINVSAVSVGSELLPWRLEAPFGLEVTSEHLLGSPAVILLVPGAFTPVCTDEVRSHAEALAGTRLLVVSCDPAPVLHAWREHLGLPDLEVGSDFWPHGSFIRSLEGFDENRGVARRRTVLLDAAGVVRWVTGSASGKARNPLEARDAVARLRDPASHAG